MKRKWSIDGRAARRTTRHNGAICPVCAAPPLGLGGCRGRSGRPRLDKKRRGRPRGVIARYVPPGGSARRGRRAVLDWTVFDHTTSAGQRRWQKTHRRFVVGFLLSAVRTV
jgi:hypothetical protein